MSAYIVKTLPRSTKLDRVVYLSDLTEEVFVTTSAGMAKSAVDGSRRPTAAFRVGTANLAIFSNLPRTNAGIPRGTHMFIAGAAKKPQYLPQAKPKDKKKFDKTRRDEKPKRELIVERV